MRQGRRGARRRSGDGQGTAVDYDRHPKTETTSFRRIPAGRAPSWRATIKQTRRVSPSPGVVGPIGLTVFATLAWVAISAYGVVELDLLWAIAAVLAGGSMLLLALRGFPVLALLPLATGAVTWGLASRPWLPESGGDVVGMIGFAALNLAYDVPLLVAYAAAVTVDARRVALEAVDDAFSGRRWWGEPDDHLPQLAELEAIPSARFFALPSGACSHIVVAGRRAVLVMPTIWPRGEYVLDAGGVQRSGLPFEHGTEDVEGLAGELRRWQERLRDTGVEARGYVIVYPPRDGVADDVLIGIRPGERLLVVHAHEFAESAGGWLAADPYHVHVPIMEHLLPAAPPAGAGQGVGVQPGIG